MFFLEGGRVKVMKRENGEEKDIMYYENGDEGLAWI